MTAANGTTGVSGTTRATTTVTRIAMWSGPRSLSTALMRSWENRADTVVSDEPLYAYYLTATGIDHPGRDAVLASQPSDWRTVVRGLTTDEVPAQVWFQKHMTHHVLPEVDLDALEGLRHAYLVRQPDALLASYAKVREEPTLADLGVARQVELFRRFPGPVVDAADLSRDPAGTLQRLCADLDVPWDPAMLHWPAGPRDSDGVWAPYWYDAVVASTGFAPYRPVRVELPPHLAALAAECRTYYDEISRTR